MEAANCFIGVWDDKALTMLGHAAERLGKFIPIVSNAQETTNLRTPATFATLKYIEAPTYFAYQTDKIGLYNLLVYRTTSKETKIMSTLVALYPYIIPHATKHIAIW